MSTELSNGVIIPEEYSDDWYDEMSINLRKLNDVITAASDNATDIQRLDTDKANQSDLTALSGRVSQNETDIIALQTAVSGALKREIVQTLPTEDISTTTIYMIRNSQSSGTNIYDEYMYINSQWELIGTSATDFSNYYTKNESDNLLSAKANQTDLTALGGRVTQTETDITALQTAVSGALKREIVQSLPTQDISTTTIYMIRNTTTSGDNIYDEYMYINNLWELIGTSATDLTNYYTKAEVDGKLLLKASASDLTSHTGNTTIHVTTADKNKWNNQTYVFRYSSTALTASSTNSNTLLDNTDNLKVGDKVIDSSGVLFSVTAIDTQNSTFTIGTALIDLAQDSDVVHKSGDETISGVKSFINYFWGKDLSGQTVDLNDCVDAYGGAIHYYYAVSNYTNISNKPENKPFILESKTVRYVSSIDYIYYQKIYTADYNAPPSIYTRYYRSGSATWSNWIKDTDKFVTTDTNQTISGAKTFSEDIVINNSDTSQNSKRLVIRSSKVKLGDSNSDSWGISFNAGASYVSLINSEKSPNSMQGLSFSVRTKDTDNNLISASYRLRINTDGSAYLMPNETDSISLGSSVNRWKDCQTNLINGVEPSSLSLPSGNASDVIDISSYITALDGTSNSYTVPANGWISIAVVGTAIAIVSSRWSDSRLRASSGNVKMLYPVLKNEALDISVIGTTLAYARFIPCQGNI